MPRTLTFFLASAFLSSLSIASASEQQPDRLTYKGKKHDLLTTPLENYFAKHPKQRLKPKIVSTDCWRGYIARWEIRQARLRFVSLGDCDDKPMSLAGTVLQLKRGTAATWFTGVLRVPLGKRIQLVHQGYHSQYEKDLLLWIRDGRLIRERMFDNRLGKQTRISQPRSKRTIAKALSKARAVIKRECFSKGPRPRSLALKMRVTAAGIHLDVQILPRPSRELERCVRTAVELNARFSVANGEETVRYRLKLR